MILWENEIISIPMEIDMVEVGKRLRIIRGGRSLIEFAPVIGMSKNMVSLYERGEAWPKPETLKMYAQIGGVSFDWILNGKESERVAEEPPAEWGTVAFHRKLTPDQDELLRIMEQIGPDARELMEAFIRLPKSKQKKRLGEMLADLEEIERESK